MFPRQIFSCACAKRRQHFFWMPLTEEIESAHMFNHQPVSVIVPSNAIAQRCVRCVNKHRAPGFSVATDGLAIHRGVCLSPRLSLDWTRLTTAPTFNDAKAMSSQYPISKASDYSTRNFRKANPAGFSERLENCLKYSTWVLIRKQCPRSWS